MNTLISKTKWHGLDALALETEAIRTITVPELGAKVVSLFDKRSGREWLVGSGSRPVKKVAYGASFEEQDLSGWDEMFPTIVACPYPEPGERHGVPLPDHGEVWALPWAIENSEAGKLTLRVNGKALPYELARTLEYSSPTSLEMHYQLTSLAEVRMLYLWSAHPLFVCESGAEIVFPSRVKEVCNTIPASWGWGEPETRFSWPLATGLDGQAVRIDQVGPPSLRKARKFYLLPDMHLGWVGLARTDQRDWLRMEWNPAPIPYLGLWVDEGALSHESVAAPEPTTGFYDSLAVAYEKNEVAVLEPGTVQTWDLRVRMGLPGEPFPYDE
jgi:galactose mutarotase-like enzyme